MTKEKHCAGFVKRGYWKGHPCGAHPTEELKGYWWCRNHRPLNDPELREALKRRREYDEQHRS